MDSRSMRKTVGTLIALCLLGMVGLVIWRHRAPPEPVYRGKPLDVWLEGYFPGNSRPDGSVERSVDFAVRQIGTNALPNLLELLRTGDSGPRPSFARLVGRWR